MNFQWVDNTIYMEKRIVLILALMISIFGNAQVDTLTTHDDCKKFIYNCLDSLIIRNPENYNSLRNIRFEISLTGEIIKYDLNFEDGKQKISKKDYRWLLELLNQKNFKTIAMIVNADMDIAKQKFLIMSLRYRLEKV